MSSSNRMVYVAASALSISIPLIFFYWLTMSTLMSDVPDITFVSLLMKLLPALAGFFLFKLSPYSLGLGFISGFAAGNIALPALLVLLWGDPNWRLTFELWFISLRIAVFMAICMVIGVGLRFLVERIRRHLKEPL